MNADRIMTATVTITFIIACTAVVSVSAPLEENADPDTTLTPCPVPQMAETTDLIMISSMTDAILPCKDCDYLIS